VPFVLGQERWGIYTGSARRSSTLSETPRRGESTPREMNETVAESVVYEPSDLIANAFPFWLSERRMRSIVRPVSSDT
jgi:hypothetical protein